MMPRQSDEACAQARMIACLLTAGVALSVLTGATAAAQSGSSSAFKGFGNNKDPIQIEADTMNVATPNQLVTFTGGVVVRQKDATLTTSELKVYYDNNGQPGSTPISAPASGSSAAAPNAQLRRFEAAGGVKITEPDQSVTGDSGWFDIASQKAEVDGHVVLTQAKNVARGSKLLINLKTGEYKLEGGTGRVQLMIDPNAAAPGASAKPK
jgi:lipopolysaccharide export system protein LptA